MKTRAISIETLVAVAALCVAATAQANSLYAFARIQKGFTSQCQLGGPGFDQAMAFCAVPPESGFQETVGNANAHALYGTLSALARLASAWGDGNNYDSLASSGFTDSLRIDSAVHPPGNSGTAFLTFTVEVDDSIVGELTSGSVGPKTAFFLDVNGTSRSPLSPGKFPTLRYQVNFQYGIPFEITAQLETKVSCSSCMGSYDVTADASNTATLDLVEVSGLALDAFVVSGDSGGGYANVVPEPGAGAAALASLAALSGLAARRSRQRAA